MAAEPGASARGVTRAATLALQSPALLSGAYSLTLLGAAAIARPRPDVGAAATRFTVLIPAHDEQAGLPATLRSLAAVDYPASLLDVVVIADNCSDATADVAREHGVAVLERHDPDQRGKGQALAWALVRLGDRVGDAVAVLDADCLAQPSLLHAFDRELRAGADAVQADYRVSNSGASEAAALRAGAFVLHNTVRPRGRERLGCSAGLHGTGMAFARATLQRLPWEAYGVAEDREYHFRLVDAGMRVAFAADAAVVSAMPTTDAVAEEQQLRWEGQKGDLARTWVPRLLADGLRTRDRVRLEAALEALMPPQSLVLVSAVAGAALAVGLRSRPLLVTGAAALGAQAAYVLGGLAVGDAPPETYRALRATPRLLTSRVRVFGRLARGGGPTTWQRTARS